MSPFHQLRDLLSLLLLLAGPMPLAAAVAARATGPRDTTPRVLVVLLTWIALQTTVGLLLGLAGGLSLPWLLAAEVLLLALGIIALRRVAPTASAPLRLARYEEFLLGGLGALGLALLWVVSAYPSNEWDSLAYHLPAMAQWYQTGHLVRLPHDLQQTACYPYGWELLCALFLLPFRGDLLAMFPNLLAWALFGLAVYGLARELGATRVAALASAAVLLALPSVVANVNTMHVDLAVAGFLSAAICLAVRHSRTRERWDACFCLGALALACGAKSSSLLYLPPVLAALLLLPRLRRAQSDLRPTGLAPIAAALGLWLVSSFWYLRNWIELGNPLAPLTVRLGHQPLFPGFVESSVLRPRTLFYMFRVSEPDHWRVLAKALYASGGWPLFGLAMAALLALAAVASRRASRRPIAFAAIWALVAGLLYALTPLTGDSGLHGRLVWDYVASQLRTGFPFLAALAVLSALGLTAVRMPAIATVVGALASALLALADLRLVALAPGVLVVWAAYRLLTARRSRARIGLVTFYYVRFRTLALAVALLVLVIFAAGARREAHRLAVYGPVVQYLSEQAPPDATVGYLLCAQNYLLYGPHLDRRVVAIPLRSQSPAEWQQFLAANHIDLVAIGPDMNTFSASDRELVHWLQSPAGPLGRAYAPGLNQPTIYRVKPH